MAGCGALWLPFLAGTLAAQSTAAWDVQAQRDKPAAIGTAPKASEQDYPARAKLEKLSIGAEYLIHSFSSGRQMFIARDYLVVEVALFPAKGENMAVSTGQFSLRVNGRKQAISPQTAEIVANALKYPDLNTSQGAHSVEQVGPVIFGAPQNTERFPGDPNARIPRVPPGAPGDNPGGEDKEPRERRAGEWGAEPQKDEALRRP